MLYWPAWHCICHQVWACKLRYPDCFAYKDICPIWCHKHSKYDATKVAQPGLENSRDTMIVLSSFYACLTYISLLSKIFWTEHFSLYSLHSSMQGPLGFLKNSDLEGLFPLKRFEVNAAVTLSLACLGTKRGPRLQPDLLLRPLFIPVPQRAGGRCV